MSRDVIKRDGGEVQHGDDEDAEPSREEEDHHGADIVSVLSREAAGELLAAPKMIESCVPVDGSWNLEAWRAKQACVLANRAVQRNHHLGREQAVVAGPGSGGIGDVVAQKVAGADRGAGHAK